MIKGWRYYNHALIPTIAPHEEANLLDIRKREFWCNWEGFPFFARWTTAFDCGQESTWWYVIKDTPFDISLIKSKRRYEINKGIKNFDVRVIRAADYAEEIYQVTRKAYEQYPVKYRPKLNHDEFISTIESWDSHEVWGGDLIKMNKYYEDMHGLMFMIHI